MKDLTEIEEKLKKLGLTDAEIKPHLRRLEPLIGFDVEPEIRNGMCGNGCTNLTVDLRRKKRGVRFFIYKTRITAATTEIFGNRLIGKGFGRYGSRKEVEYLLRWINE